MKKCPKCGGAQIETVYRPKSNTLRKFCETCLYSWQEQPTSREARESVRQEQSILREPVREGDGRWQ